MANEVYANNNEIACKAASGKSICALPDVCMTPPENPATPPGVPVPYPNTGVASDTTEGSRTVQISGKEVMLKNKSCFKKSVGDEAGSAAKKGVVTSINTGKVYFISWSTNVKIEGENVDRHLDTTTHNHGSDPPNEAVPMVYVDKLAPGSASSVDETKCPCCHQDLHDSQKGPDGKRAPQISQQEFYRQKKAAVDKKVAGLPDWSAKYPTRVSEKMELNFGSDLFDNFVGTPAEVAAEESRRAQEMLDELESLTRDNPRCPNLSQTPDQGCGTHLNTPPGAAKSGRKQWNRHRDRYVKWAQQHGMVIKDDTKINHKTPIGAGGCPLGGSPENGFANVVPDPLPVPCETIDKLQTALQSR